MKIKGGGCAGLCQGFNPNESKCQCYGCQKPCGGGRRACGRRELYGGCCGCDEPPPPKECKTCDVNDLIYQTTPNGGIIKYKITKNKKGVITCDDGNGNFIEIGLNEQQIYYPDFTLSEVNFEGIQINQDGAPICFVKATSDIDGYEQTWTYVKSSRRSSR